jgi:hypothetical protein
VEPDRPEEYPHCYAEQKERKGKKTKKQAPHQTDINDFNGALIVDQTSQ